MEVVDRAKCVVQAFKATAALATAGVVVIGDTSYDRQVKVPTGTSDVPLGVTLNTAPTAGDLVDVCLFGICQAKTGAGVTRYSWLQINDTSGYVKAVTTGGYAVGVALNSVSSGEYVTLFVNPNCVAHA